MRGVPQNPEGFFAKLAEKMSINDQSLLMDPRTLAVLSSDLRNAFRQGTIGMADDFKVLSRPWSFSLRDIEIPVHIWQGAQDRVINPRIGAAIAARIPHAQYHQPENSGHMVLLTHAREIHREISTND